MLMNLSYDLKKKNPGLKRNIKFDEEDNGLFMDVRMGQGEEWRRIKPERAAAACRRRKNWTKDLDGDELRSLLGDSGEDE